MVYRYGARDMRVTTVDSTPRLGDSCWTGRSTAEHFVEDAPEDVAIEELKGALDQLIPERQERP